MLKNERKKNSLVIIYIILSLVLIRLLVYNNPQVILAWVSVESKYSSCEGIEEYYTNTSFHNDAINLVYVANDCYNLKEVEARLYAPIDLKNCSGKYIDCEDISHFVGCLGKMYDVRCEYYVTLSTYEAGHRGVICLVDGEWKQYN